MSKVKTIVFAMLIAMMVVPISAYDTTKTAEATEQVKYDSKSLENAIREITPYVELGEDRIVIFTIKKESIPLEKDVLDIAFDYIELQNSYISQINENPDEKPVIDDKLMAKFSKVVQEVQKAKNRPEKPTITNSNLVLSQTKSTWYQTEICGGGFISPHPNTSFIDYLSTSPHNDLLTLGFHLTAQIGHYENDGNDYTKTLGQTHYSSLWECSTGQFRDHGRAHTITYSIQYTEPNPELDTYESPIWWWDGYVFFWHQVLS